MTTVDPTMQEPCSKYGGNGSCTIGIQNMNCRKCEHIQWENESLAKGICPYSGENIVEETWYYGPPENPTPYQNRACSMCDCFGYALDDPRLPQL